MCGRFGRAEHRGCRRAPPSTSDRGGEEQIGTNSIRTPRGQGEKLSVVVPSAAPVLSREVYLWMDHSHVPGESVIPGKRLLLGAERTSDFLLAGVVDCVFVPCEVVRPREDGVAGLARRRVDTLALVWASLAVALQKSRRCHARAHSRRVCVAMAFALVFLKLLRSFETQCAAVVRAGIRARVSG